MRVVVEPAARNEGREVGGDCLDLEAGDEERKIMRMDADVGETGRGAGAGGVGAPFRLLLPVGVDRLRQPVLDIGCVHDPDGADVAGRDHLTRLTHHRIASVVERDGEDEARSGATSSASSLGLGERSSVSGLSQIDVDSRHLEETPWRSSESARRFGVTMTDGLDPLVGPRSLASPPCRHRPRRSGNGAPRPRYSCAPVTLCSSHVTVTTGRPPTSSTSSIQPHAAMRCTAADEGALPAADHAHPEPPLPRLSTAVA